MRSEHKLSSLPASACSRRLPLVAHHSFAAEFDATKAVTLQGTVTKLDWMNPHIWIYLDAKDDSGTVAHWQCEGGPPNTLTRNGWSKDSLKMGDQVNIEGFRSKDGTNTCNARSVKLPERQARICRLGRRWRAQAPHAVVTGRAMRARPHHQAILVRIRFRLARYRRHILPCAASGRAS